MLLEHKADPSLGSNEIGIDNTCVHAAVIHNDVAVLGLLLSHGAAHSAPGKGGWTALTLAARSGAVACILPLLAAGANPDAATPMGKSPRELAVINQRITVIEVFDDHKQLALEGQSPGKNAAKNKKKREKAAAKRKDQVPLHVATAEVVSVE